MPEMLWPPVLVCFASLPGKVHSEVAGLRSQETQELRQKAEQTAFELAQEKDELTAEVSTN